MSTKVFSSTSRKLNIALVTTGRIINAKGGAERVFCNMANALAERGHVVTAICFDKNTGGIPGYPIDKDVAFINAYYKPPFWMSKTALRIRSFSFSKRKRHYIRSVLSSQIYATAIVEKLPRGG